MADPIDSELVCDIALILLVLGLFLAFFEAYDRWLRRSKIEYVVVTPISPADYSVDELCPCISSYEELHLYKNPVQVSCGHVLCASCADSLYNYHASPDKCLYCRKRLARKNDVGFKERWARQVCSLLMSGPIPDKKA